MSTAVSTQQNQPAQVAFNFFDKEQFEVMQRVCKMFSSSELVPEIYRTNLTPDKNGNPTNTEAKAISNCMVAIEMATRIGASPLMVMQNMAVIHGRPSWSSKFLIATVNSCGRFNSLQYKFTNLGMVGKLSITEYQWDGKRKVPVVREFDGSKIENIQCIAFTSERGHDVLLESSPIDVRMAILEGWYTKAGSKWVTMTKQMLQYRSASFWTNAYAPELSMGMKTTEEVADIEDISFEEILPTPEEDKKKKANKKGTMSIVLDDTPEPSDLEPDLEMEQKNQEEIDLAQEESQDEEPDWAK